jgi:hypothetical protein
MDAITALVRAKAVTRELGEGVVPEPIRRFVLHEFGLVAKPTFRAWDRRPGRGVRGLHRPAQAIRTDTRVEISVNDPTIPP